MSVADDPRRCEGVVGHEETGPLRDESHRSWIEKVRRTAADGAVVEGMESVRHMHRFLDRTGISRHLLEGSRDRTESMLRSILSIFLIRRLHLSFPFLVGLEPAHIEVEGNVFLESGIPEAKRTVQTADSKRGGTTPGDARRLLRLING